MSIINTVTNYLTLNVGPYTTAEIATATGLTNKQVSSVLSRLKKEGAVLRDEDGAYSLEPRLRNTLISEEAAENWVNQTDPGAPSFEEPEQAEEDLIGDFAEEATEEPAEEPAAGSPSFNLAAMKRKIAALLAKAEKTDNEHERDAFNSKAEHLMLRLGVHAAELEAAGEVKPEDIVEVKRDWKGNYSIVFVPFTWDVAHGFGHLTVLQSTFSPMLRRTYIIGHKGDVEQFISLLDSLEVQVLSALRRWQNENREARRGLTDMQKYIQHRSFIEGFGATVRCRLEEERVEEEEQASTGAALVLVDKSTRVQGWVDDKYGQLGKARGGMQYGSSIAHQAGRIAGQSANLGGTPEALKG